MGNSLKKAFSTFVSLSTIAWSVGLGSLAVPTAASAAMLSSGDLIKASGPAVYYYAADGKRYVFPNEKTYFSWFSDFSMVKTISDSELAAIMIGGNVTVRPGTKLVKITTDPKVYAVGGCGTLHWIESESIAKALYGDAWGSRVIDVPDSFFVNYTVGSSVSTNVHPDGQLVMYSGDSSTYVVWGGMKRKFASDSALMANMMNKANAVMTSISYGNGSDVTGRESALADAVCLGSVTPVSGNLTVSLASDTPAGMTTTKNASSVKLVKVNLMAGSSDVTVSGLRFTRVGVGNTSDFSNVYLYDGQGTRLTTGRTINSQTNVVEFNALNVTVPAGQTKSVFVYGDFSSPSATGGQHAFRIADAASVIVSGSATVAGAFPITGNVFTVGTESSARVDIQKGIQPSNPNVGAQGAEISNFKVTANTNDIEISQITLYQAGSVTNSDLSKLELFQGADKVASTDAVSANGRIVLKFNPAYVITNGQTRVFSLRANVAGRSGRTIKTYVEYTTDVTATDKKFNAGASICIQNSASPCTGSSASFDGSSSNFIEVTTQGGQFTNTFNGPATQNIAKGLLQVPLYKFALTSPDNTFEIRNIAFTVARVNGSGASCRVFGSNSTVYFRNLKVVKMDANGAITGTFMGPKELTQSSSATGTVTFSDSNNIMAGTTLNLALVADLASSEDASGEFFANGNCSYNASFTAFGSSDIRDSQTGEFLATSKIVPNNNVTGNALTVKSSSLALALASNPGSGTVVKKQSGVAVGGITLEASNQSDVKVTSLSVSGKASLAGAAYSASDFATRVTAISLWDGEVQVGDAKAPDTTTGKAQVTNMNFTIPKGTTKTLTVKATFSSSVATTAPFDRVAVGVGSPSTDISAQDQEANTVTPTVGTTLGGASPVAASQLGTNPPVVQEVRPNGVLTVQTEAHPVSNIVVANSGAWTPLARYRAVAQYEDVEIDRIAVFASSTVATNADNADYAEVAIASGNAVKGMNQLSSGVTGTKDIDLTTGKIIVPKDGNVTFEIWGKMAALTPSSTNAATSGLARSGHLPAIGLRSGLTTDEWDSNYASSLNIRSTGKASGERLYAGTTQASHGNVMVLRKSVPVVAKQALSSTLSNTTLNVFKFNVTANGGPMAWKQMMFQLSVQNCSSCGNQLQLSNWKLLEGSVEYPTGQYAITGVTSGAAVNLKTGSAASTTNFVIVSFAPGYEASLTLNETKTYTLTATISGSGSGANATLSFYRDPTAPVVTAYLSSTGAFGGVPSSANIFHLDTAVAPDNTANATGTFVWSDLVEPGHSREIGTSNGTRDWTNDVYVQSLNDSQSLSAN
jgi:hypothetical protein